MGLAEFIRTKRIEMGKDLSMPEWAHPEMITLNEEIDRVRGLLQTARNNFNFVTDPELVEYYIYLQKAVPK